MSCWIHLGIEPTQDLDAIRLAYRGRLPQHHPETDPEGFQALREAYEQALRLAREHATTSNDELAQPPQQDAPHPALQRFHALLEQPTRRFDPQAWQDYIAELDDLPLDELDELSGYLLSTLLGCGPLSHQCANLLAKRLAWAEQLLRMENPQEVEALLNRLEQPDPFDTALMREWPSTAQLETLWYFRSLEYCYHSRPLFEYEAFANTHLCLGIPDDPALIERLMLQFSQTGVASRTFHAELQERQRQHPNDPDLLQLLAMQAEALGNEQQALDCWLQLYHQHQNPQAERRLIALCARHQPQRLPLLIQAFDRLHSPAVWPEQLDDPAQVWGSPGQTPQTLARWSEAARLQLDGIAGIFVDWRLDGDDELPLLAWLLQEQDDHDLHRRYWQAWALQRGECGLLRLILAQQVPDDSLDALIVQGFQRQAAQQLQWLEQAPVAQALVSYCANIEPGQKLPAALLEEAVHPACREWLRRMRRYCAQAVYELNCNFEMGRMFTVPFALKLQGRLAEDGVLLPPMPMGEELWQWHRQQLFMLAMIDQPARWRTLIDPALPGQLHYPHEHPFAATHKLMLEVPEGGLLGSLDSTDPVQAWIAGRLMTLHQALDSVRVPNAVQLLACLDNDDGSLHAEHGLGYFLFCAVLYHDRSLDETQRSALGKRLQAVSLPGDWFEPWRSKLLNGKTPHPPAKVVYELGVDSRWLNDVLDALDHLLNHCTPPKTRTLRALQKAKDDEYQDPGLRCAIMAVLSWTERMLVNDLKEPAEPAWAFWKLKSRLNRSGFALHLVAAGLSAALIKLIPAMSVVAVILLFSGLLRRLRDIGQGVPALLVLLLISRVLPVLPLFLLGLPGDKLPNRYGPVPGPAEPLEGGLQASLRRINGQ